MAEYDLQSFNPRGIKHFKGDCSGAVPEHRLSAALNGETARLRTLIASVIREDDFAR
jgi:hypothetical protein